MTDIRLAAADDADAIARIQITAWRAAYVPFLETKPMTDDARTPHNGDNTVGPRDSYQILTGSKLDSILPARTVSDSHPERIDPRCAPLPTLSRAETTPLEAAIVPLALHG